MFNYIQLLTTLLALLAVLSLFRSYKQGLLPMARLLGWFVLFLIAVVVVFEPRISDRVASFLGVARGTDAAFFIAILLLFYVNFKLLARIEGIEQGITKIVREISLRNGSGKME